MKMHGRMAMAALFLMGPSALGKQVVSRQPAQGAEGVCVDTHLTLTFDDPPTLGTTGTIRIYDASDDKVVDTTSVR
jgi:hypothetical protein